MADAAFGTFVSDQQRGSESGLTLLVRPQDASPAVFPFGSLCRSDHSGWDPLNTTTLEESTHEEE